MKHKRVIPRTQADRDVQEAVDYYLNEGAEQAALAFVDAIEQAFRYIGRHPDTGSTRYAQELDLPGLRCWPVKRYRYLCFMSSGMTTSMSGAFCTANETFRPGFGRATERGGTGN